jgi:preprotein translocase subunit SecD
MFKNSAGKTAFIVAVIAVFLYGIFFGANAPRTGSVKTLLGKSIHLGLDLKGGAHLVLKVHVDEAIASATDRDVARLKEALLASGQTGVTVGKLEAAHPETISVTGIPAGKGSDVRTLLNGTDYAIYDVSTAGDGGYKLTLKQSAINDLEARTLDTEIETIYERVNALGVSEPTVQKYGLGDNEILVELPGIDNLDQVRDAISSTSKLAVYAVVSGPYESDQAALAALSGIIPPDDQLVHGSAMSGGPDQVYLLERASQVEGTDFRDAQSSTDINGRPNLKFSLTTAAGDRFYKYTSAHSRDSANPGSMAIVLGNKIRSVASINSAIRDQGEIEGNFSKAEVDELSLMLRTGALPASFDFLETRTVGPSLGAASIRQGVIAAVAGLLLVMVFMLVYYKGSGINADLALLLNLIILLGFMGFSGAVLTLPGIAGVILTIGMGVDSNVLIFERIREELRAGKTAVGAVKEGFAHAWTTIIDTHVTTIVSAAILFLFGTGPIKGFAVTLTIGLLSNLFTAVFVSRLIFDKHLEGKDRTFELSI